MWWQVQSRNKLSVALDLKDEASRSVVLKLIGEVDVLVENFRPSLVMLRISGYGQTGPYTDRPGFGVVAEAMGGLRHLTAEPGRVPVRVGVSIGDTLASLHGGDRHPDGLAAPPRQRQYRRAEGAIDVALHEAVCAAWSRCSMR